MSAKREVAAPISARTRRRRTSLTSRFGRDGVLLLLGLPGAVIVVLFNYVPLAGNIAAFQDFQPFLGFEFSPWVGFDNFVSAFQDRWFYTALGNTLILTLIQVVFVFPIPIALAILLNSMLSESVKRVVQSILYLPHFLSWVIVVAIFQQVLGNAGMINTFLRSIELSTIEVIGVPELFRFLLTTQVIWKDTGWSMIIFLAALSRVDVNLYEAAAIDGAGAWRRMWHVTLPAIRGVIVLLLILKLGDSLTVGFEQIILQQQAVGRQASEVLDTYVYNFGISEGNWGVAAAVGLAKGIVSVALVLAANKMAHVFGEQGVYSR